MTQTCPLCNASVARLVRHFSSEADQVLLSMIEQDHPGWQALTEACTRCVDHYYSRLRFELPEDDKYILPTPLRLAGNKEFTGRGVTICMIDSGFYEHPDLVRPSSRILKILDITDPRRGGSYFRKASDDSWHGTMTSVVAAGNGWLSGGIYRSLSSQANLVLLKVMHEGRIEGKDIASAIHWAIEHKEKYGIRIINLSVTDDWPLSHKVSAVDQAAEAAVDAGLVVVAAAGNDPQATTKPPANSPQVITVGGIDDHNTLGEWPLTAYHSAFGTTVDGFHKPELVAPSIWLAAPILPGTPENLEAHKLFGWLDALEKGNEWLDETLTEELERMQGNKDALRSRVREQLERKKFILPDYLHADGTSFAAPIVCSIIAQMLEANPGLSPHMVKQILLGTATRLHHIPWERQGFGLINAALAVKRAADEKHISSEGKQPWVQQHAVRFVYHHDTAMRVDLVGSFTDWTERLPLSRDGNGIWYLDLPLPSNGRYAYKFLVDGSLWQPDPAAPVREPDGFGGFNSVLVV